MAAAHRRCPWRCLSILEIVVGEEELQYLSRVDLERLRSYTFLGLGQIYFSQLQGAGGGPNIIEVGESGGRLWQHLSEDI